MIVSGGLAGREATSDNVGARGKCCGQSSAPLMVRRESLDRFEVVRLVLLVQDDTDLVDTGFKEGLHLDAALVRCADDGDRVDHLVRNQPGCAVAVAR